MQRQPLPKLVDARKFASTGAEISAFEDVAKLPRFCAGLATGRGSVAADFHFYRDEQGFFRLDGELNAEVDVVCERCLQPKSLNVTGRFELAIVWTDDQAKALPRSLDPLILGEEALELAELLQDELILNTPFVNYHAPEECSAPTSAAFGPESPEVVEEEKGESPFSVLGQLKPKD